MNPYAPPASFLQPPTFGGRGKINVGIEIGTSTICVAVGERKSSGMLIMMGVAMVPSRGVEKGRIVDLEQARECLRMALKAAKYESDVMIREVYLAVTGASVASCNRTVGIDMPGNRNRIKERDRKAVEKSARDLDIPDQNAFIHHFLQSYRIDGVESHANPVGMDCQRLEACFHVVQGAKESIQDFIDCVTERRIKVIDVVFSPFAAANIVLDEDQKGKGALLIDLGAGTTEYVMYRDGVVHQSGVLALGGNHISNDISIYYGISFTEAERLKIEEGSAWPGLQRTERKVIAEPHPLIASGKVDRQKLNEIIHARIRETLEILKRKLDAEPRINDLRAGILLTGGASLMPGIARLTEEVFGSSVHLTLGSTIDGFEEKFQNPRYTCALGLLGWG